ncbi:MAG: CARDB domain-containing protein [Clostridium paraputrificum]|uniref:CARDB domain-containing protein n=1 Tax=Clostridium sp. TaxID=1506 RepID=UPI0025C1AEE0|nr:CARDB domain-containing protein [Clostridium sp.]MBS5926230.1 hypothetical protein [Clostridium sp.]
MKRRQLISKIAVLSILTPLLIYPKSVEAVTISEGKTMIEKAVRRYDDYYEYDGYAYMFSYMSEYRKYGHTWTGTYYESNTNNRWSDPYPFKVGDYLYNPDPTMNAQGKRLIGREADFGFRCVNNVWSNDSEYKGLHDNHGSRPNTDVDYEKLFKATYRRNKTSPKFNGLNVQNASYTQGNVYWTKPNKTLRVDFGGYQEYPGTGGLRLDDWVETNTLFIEDKDSNKSSVAKHSHMSGFSNYTNTADVPISYYSQWYDGSSRQTSTYASNLFDATFKYDAMDYALKTNHKSMNGKDNGGIYDTGKEIRTDGQAPKFNPIPTIEDGRDDYAKITFHDVYDDRGSGDNIKPGVGLATSQHKQWLYINKKGDSSVGTYVYFPKIVQTGTIELNGVKVPKYDMTFTINYDDPAYESLGLSTYEDEIEFSYGTYDLLDNSISSKKFTFSKKNPRPEAATLDLTSWNYAEPNSNKRWVNAKDEFSITTTLESSKQFSRLTDGYPSYGRLDLLNNEVCRYADKVSVDKLEVINSSDFINTKDYRAVEGINKDGIKYITINHKLKAKESGNGKIIELGFGGYTVFNGKEYWLPEELKPTEKDGEVLCVDAVAPTLQSDNVSTRTTEQFVIDLKGIVDTNGSGVKSILVKVWADTPSGKIEKIYTPSYNANNTQVTVKRSDFNNVFSGYNYQVTLTDNVGNKRIYPTKIASMVQNNLTCNRVDIYDPREERYVTQVISGLEYEAVIEVQNNGERDLTSSFDVALNIDGVYSSKISATSIAKGEKKDYRIKFVAGKENLKGVVYQGVADYGNKIVETNENDNIASTDKPYSTPRSDTNPPTIPTTPGKGEKIPDPPPIITIKFDLKAKLIDTVNKSNDTVKPYLITDDEIRVKYQIENLGSLNVKYCDIVNKAFINEVSYDGTKIDSVSISDIKKGEIKTFYKAYTIPNLPNGTTQANKVFKLSVDSTNVIDEVDETNNIATVTKVVKQLDVQPKENSVNLKTWKYAEPGTNNKWVNTREPFVIETSAISHETYLKYPDGIKLYLGDKYWDNVTTISFSSSGTSYFDKYSNFNAVQSLVSGKRTLSATHNLIAKTSANGGKYKISSDAYTTYKGNTVFSNKVTEKDGDILCVDSAAPTISSHEVTNRQNDTFTINLNNISDNNGSGVKSVSVKVWVNTPSGRVEKIYTPTKISNILSQVVVNRNDYNGVTKPYSYEITLVDNVDNTRTYTGNNASMIQNNLTCNRVDIYDPREERYVTQVISGLEYEAVIEVQNTGEREISIPYDVALKIDGVYKGKVNDNTTIKKDEKRDYRVKFVAGEENLSGVIYTGIADYSDSIYETNESDNTKGTKSPYDKPRDDLNPPILPEKPSKGDKYPEPPPIITVKVDLKARYINTVNLNDDEVISELIPEDVVRIKYQIENTGSFSTKYYDILNTKFKNAIYYDNALIKEVDISSIAKGEVKTFYQQYTIPLLPDDIIEDTKELKLSVDINNQVYESNESNNTLITRKKVIGLKVTDYRITDIVYPPVKYTYPIYIKNMPVSVKAGYNVTLRADVQGNPDKVVVVMKDLGGKSYGTYEMNKVRDISSNKAEYEFIFTPPPDTKSDTIFVSEIYAQRKTTKYDYNKREKWDGRTLKIGGSLYDDIIIFRQY